MRNIVESVSSLPDRAGYAIMAFGAKSDYGCGADPFELIPEPLSGFCESVLGMSPALLAMKMETYMLSGGVAAVELHEVKTSNVRSEVADLLRISLRE